MRNAIRALWSEPAAPHPPPPLRRDWAVSGILVVVAVVEATQRSVPWKPLQLTFALLVILMFPWRRTHPFAVTMTALVAALAVALAGALTGRSDDGIYTAAIILIYPYSLLRWGSGRAAFFCVPLLLVLPWVGLIDGSVIVSEAAAGTVFLEFPAAIGASVRYRQASRERAIEQARLHEREQLARELHDTVAHHVSAIAIQAQAGKTVGANDPAAARRALDVIEEEASRTLVEMRAMVVVLRQNEPVDLAPQRGVADIRRLADATGMPQVEVQLTGELEGLRPAVETAVYRLAQESITNARRHARHATNVVVLVAGEKAAVRLTVRDDGAGSVASGDGTGFGLAGMAERAKLLGGTFRAGPGTERGWLVEAVIPRNGDAA